MPYTLTLTHICKERKTAKKAFERVGFNSDVLVTSEDDDFEEEEEKKEYPLPPLSLLSSLPLVSPNKAFSMCSFVSAFNRLYTSLKIVLASFTPA